MSDDLFAHIEFHLSDPKPVSVNRMYGTRQGRRYLTNEGRTFKDALKAEAVNACLLSSVPWPEVIDSIYKRGYYAELHVQLFLSNLLNKSWKPGGGETKGGAPRSPYTKLDATNYLKLIEDAVSEGVGIDDSCTMQATIVKIPCDEKDIGVHVQYLVRKHA